MASLEELRGQVATLGAAYESWATYVDRELREKRQPMLDEGLEALIERTIDMGRESETDLESKRIAVAIDRLEDEMATWKRDYLPKAVQWPDFYLGHQGLRNAITALVERAASPYRLSSLEPIDLLVKQGVNESQIAMMYGWRDQFGNADTARVRKAQADPELAASTQSPKDTHYLAILDAAFALHQRRPPRMMAAKASAAPKEAPESLDDLIWQGADTNHAPLTIRQMLLIRPELTREIILARALELGVMLIDEPNAAVYRPLTPHEAAMRAEKEQRESIEAANDLDALNKHEGLDTIEERIWAMSSDGIKPKDIAQILSAGGHTISHQKVGQMLAEMKRNEVASK